MWSDAGRDIGAKYIHRRCCAYSSSLVDLPLKGLDMFLRPLRVVRATRLHISGLTRQHDEDVPIASGLLGEDIGTTRCKGLVLRVQAVAVGSGSGPALFQYLYHSKDVTKRRIQLTGPWYFAGYLQPRQRI